MLKTIATAILTILAIGFLQAQQGRPSEPYLAIGAGASFLQPTEFDFGEIAGFRFDDMNVEFDTGARAWLAAGYNFTDTLAGELELGFTYSSTEDIQASQTRIIPRPGPNLIETITVTVEDAYLYTLPVLANIKYHLPLKGTVKPFVGAGVGGLFAFADIGDSDDATAFVHQAIGGLRVEISHSSDISIIYKFLGTSHLDFDDFEAEGITSHTVGLEYSFRF